MLDYIQGNIAEKNPTQVVMENGGLGYQVNISLNTFSKIQHLQQCKLFTYLHVGGGLQSPLTFSLYGFYDLNEREVFSNLLSVSGVGASTVRMMLSSMSPEEIQRAIVMGNSKLLEGIKGIGPKSAQRIILELKDKMAKGMEKQSITYSPQNNLREEALSALVMLGSNRNNAEQTLNKLLKENPNLTIEEMIKQALKGM